MAIANSVFQIEPMVNTRVAVSELQHYITSVRTMISDANYTTVNAQEATSGEVMSVGDARA